MERIGAIRASLAMAGRVPGQRHRDRLLNRATGLGQILTVGQNLSILGKIFEPKNGDFVSKTFIFAEIYFILNTTFIKRSIFSSKVTFGSQKLQKGTNSAISFKLWLFTCKQPGHTTDET